ncbi:flowering time control protein FCA isoform X2 [Impatiens glandulifera]|uniref:flowering time control protein FCA isoform X2 n=1 Tax=Impatiens glandulifera TaxID=253017 RepID=UPI001FB09A37|nr:flowering time control protein FCA isoform X2 [Impatiens glandulifera]
MDRQRGDRYGGHPDAPHFMDSRRLSPRSSDVIIPPRSSPSSYRGGFSSGGDGGPHFRQFETPKNFPSAGGAGGGGFRPFVGGGGGFDSTPQMPPLSGQKRGYPFPVRSGSPDRMTGGNFAKVFVGSVPRTATEEDIRPLFEEFGNVIEVALIRDKRTGEQQGCCFIKYPTSEEADRAIKGLHNQRILPGGTGPIQVRYADGERQRLGAVEYKLFVGSMNKQATEKEIEEIFSPYGRVEDVYLMRDEMKQSRGCGFVKFASNDMALSAINALNGKYTMNGWDQPLIVRFADPKRPKLGETRGPVFGSPDLGPRFQPPEMRPVPNLGDAMLDRMPPNSWPNMSPQGFRPSLNMGRQGFGNQLPPRSGDPTMPSAMGGNFGGPADGRFPVPGVVSSSPSQQGGNFGGPADGRFPVPGVASSSPSQQTSNVSLPKHGHEQIPQPVGQQHFGGQLPVSQPQMHPTVPSSAAKQVNSNNVQQSHSSMPTSQQLPAPHMQQMPPQPMQQPPSEFAQRLTQQRESLNAIYQSSQQAFSQVQQQFQLMQPSSRTFMPQQASQVPKQQQSQWTGVMPQSTVLAPTKDAHAAVSAIPAVSQTEAPAKCQWTEHNSPDGFKYYYNSTTGQSTWEKPEELSLFEKQQQNLSSIQLPQTQYPKGPSGHQAASQAAQQVQLQSQPLMQQVSQQAAHQVQLQSQPLMQQGSQQASQYVQHQTQPPMQQQFHNSQSLQQRSLPSQYQVSGVMGHQNNQGSHSAQDWMWRSKPSGA